MGIQSSSMTICKAKSSIVRILLNVMAIPAIPAILTTELSGIRIHPPLYFYALLPEQYVKFNIAIIAPCLYMPGLP
jgi:hypothetical protein